MRSDTDRIIADNLISIVISRKTRTKTSGKMTVATSTLAAQSVRLYSSYSAEMSSEGDEARWIRRRTVKLLCKYGADVKPHDNVYEDTFTANSNTYRIVSVRPVIWEGVTINKQCTLEEVKHA